MKTINQPSKPEDSPEQKTGEGCSGATCSASWLPIETAPRDGTDIIVGFDSTSVWVVHVAWWRELEDWMRDDPQWSEEDVGWWSYTKHSVTQEKLEGHRTPTHWMPLPSLPNAKHIHPESKA
jgi:hypothetical protein